MFEDTGSHELRITTSIPPDTLLEEVRKGVRELAASGIPADLQRDGWTRLEVADKERTLVVKLSNIEVRPEAPIIRARVAATPDGGSLLILTTLSHPQFPWAGAIVGTIGLLVGEELLIGGGVLIAFAVLLGIWEFRRPRQSRLPYDPARRYLREAMIEVLHRAESDNRGRLSG